MDSIEFYGVCVCVLGAFEAFPTNGVLDNVYHLLRAVYGVSLSREIFLIYSKK